jgi:hypothetical protein
MPNTVNAKASHSRDSLYVRIKTEADPRHDREDEFCCECQVPDL